MIEERGGAARRFDKASSTAALISINPLGVTMG
jgi:hypothetical protein